jgi:hypothetical protein
MVIQFHTRYCFRARLLPSLEAEAMEGIPYLPSDTTICVLCQVRYHVTQTC